MPNWPLSKNAVLDSRVARKWSRKTRPAPVLAGDKVYLPRIPKLLSDWYVKRVPAGPGHRRLICARGIEYHIAEVNSVAGRGVDVQDRIAEMLAAAPHMFEALTVAHAILRIHARDGDPATVRTVNMVASALDRVVGEGNA